MKYYINENGKRYAFNDDYDATAKIAELGLTPITEAEARQAVVDEQEAYKETDEYKLATNKAYLASTDYVCAKCYELGVTVAEKYPEIYAKRQEARKIVSDILNKGATTSDINE